MLLVAVMIKIFAWWWLGCVFLALFISGGVPPPPIDAYILTLPPSISPPPPLDMIINLVITPSTVAASVSQSCDALSYLSV